jgi:hypothetical protein
VAVQDWSNTAQTMLNWCLKNALEHWLHAFKVLKGIIYPLDNFQTYPNAH